jgi:uncharacterized protein YecT (DUF1311 family)
MNLAAIGRFERTTQELEEAMRELEASIPLEERGAAKVAQEAWLRFRDAQAEFAALQFQGGSAAGLMRTAEATKLTEQRLAAVRQAIGERKLV